MLNIIIHSGSRGVGYKIAEHYMKEACIKDVDEQRYIDEFDTKNIGWKRKIDETSDDSMAEKYLKARDEFVYRRTRARVKTNTEGHFGFDLDSDVGQDYTKDMNMALDFALANRQNMINKIVESMERLWNREIKTDRFINRNHNHAEIKGGFVIHRKGATHAEEGMMGVIPANMRDGAFIVKGKGNEESMCSSSHGAGRVLSRRKAKEELDVNQFHDDMQGVITNHTDGTIDESPRAYKDIFEVMELQNDLVEFVDYVKPVLNIKG